MGRKRNDESCSFAPTAVSPNGPAMAFDYPPTDGKTRSRAFVGTSAMKPLKEGEDTFGILLVKPDAVIFNEYVPAFLLPIVSFGRLAVNLDEASLLTAEFEELEIRFWKSRRIRFGSASITGRSSTAK